MAANTSPVFTKDPYYGVAQATVANSNRDGTGTLVTIATGVAEGVRIDYITIKATVTTTAGMIRLYIDDGSAVRLWREVPIPAITVSASVAAYETTLSRSDGRELLHLPSTSHILKASTEKAEAINVMAFGGKYTA